MKRFILITILMLTFEASSSAGWFSHDREQQLQEQLQQEQQHEQQLQQQFQQERQFNNHLTYIIAVLGIGCVAALVIGTMIGSKTRRASNEH